MFLSLREEGLLIRVKPLAETIASGYLTLRRFFRAYDLVGVDSDGRLVTRLFCKPEELKGVVSRIQALMSCEVTVFFGMAAAPNPGAAIMERA